MAVGQRRTLAYTVGTFCEFSGYVCQFLGNYLSASGFSVLVQCPRPVLPFSISCGACLIALARVVELLGFRRRLACGPVRGHVSYGLARLQW